MSFNSTEFDSGEFLISILLTISAFALSAIIRFSSSRVLRVDAERTLLFKRSWDENHVIMGEYSLLSLLGAPHILRSRSALAFGTLVSVVVATFGLNVAATALGGARTLKTGAPTLKATIEKGQPVLDEQEMTRYADWFRSSGVISMCQRRSGAQRVYYQPFVEIGEDTHVYCGNMLPINLRHEREEGIEGIVPYAIRIHPLEGVITFTPHSQFVRHEINFAGRRIYGVCNSGLWYRGIRDGQVSQTCAFTTTDDLILGGYHTNQSNLSAPGITPQVENLRYYDSYTVRTSVELTEAQLMQALMLWDLGSMSEVEVAVMSTYRFTTLPAVPSFVGGFDRLQLDLPILAVGLSLAAVVFLAQLGVLVWDGFSRTDEERMLNNPATIGFLSRAMRSESENRPALDDSNAPLNHIAIRDVTKCLCRGRAQHDANCSAPRRFQVGSARVGRALEQVAREDVLTGLRAHRYDENKLSREDDGDDVSINP